MANIGPGLYRLNTIRPERRLMLRRHGLIAPALFTPERIRELQLLAHRHGARFASVAFLSSGLDRARVSEWWLQKARLLQCPLHLVLATEGPTTPMQHPRQKRNVTPVPKWCCQPSPQPSPLWLL